MTDAIETRYGALAETACCLSCGGAVTYIKAEPGQVCVAGTRERGLDLAVVTNGYHLLSYLELLERAQIREIQVTLDGPPTMHDRRRHLVSGQPTFDAIAAGIDAALERGLAINLRTVLDRENLSAN